MDITLEKQKIKQEIDNIQDESIILSIKKLLGLTVSKSFTPFTPDELVARALESEKAIADTKFITIEELEREMKNW